MTKQQAAGIAILALNILAAIVAAMLGDEVQVPAELVGGGE